MLNNNKIFYSLFLFLGACATDPYTGEEKVSNAAEQSAAGAIIGGIVGASVGLITSRGDKDAMLEGAAVGGGLGALGGFNKGAELDRQEALLRGKLQYAGISVTRRADTIVLNSEKAMSFNHGSSAIIGETSQVLDAIADVLVEFDNTRFDIIGFADLSESQYNVKMLSFKRAENSASLLSSRGLVSNRMSISGNGATEPLLPSDTEIGRVANRRVEVHISPI